MEDWKPTGKVRIKSGFIEVSERILDCGYKATGFSTDLLASYIEIEKECMNPNGLLVQDSLTTGVIYGFGDTAYFPAEIIEHV